MNQPSFWEIARRPKWISGLLAALAVAAVFALLMQWQLSRTFNTVGVSVEESAPRPLSDLIAPNQPIDKPVYDRLATFESTIDSENSFIVGGRLQLEADGSTRTGYWLITNSYVENASLTIAIGFSEDLETVRQAQQKLEDLKIAAVGYVQPSEPVKESSDADFDSVALGQLINFYSQEPIASYPAYVILQSGFESELEPITIGIRQQEIEINWLTAFYAVEWAFFALAAFYLWWRLVMDQKARESEALASEEPK
jgi:cytochrome oxidase assembly protein ShyY1